MPLDGSVGAISVVVPTKDRPDLLGPCLESIRRSLRATDELVVVDSASRDPAVRRTAEAKGARYRRCDRPGASRARNRGWREAEHDVVAFVDDDVRVSTGWAEAIASALTRHPEATFLTGRIDVPTGQEGTERPVALLERDEPAVLDAASSGSIGHSANLVVRRPALELVGGFDERLGAGGPFRAAEDYDLFDRLFASGYTGRYEPRVAATHEQWRGRRDLLGLDWGYGIGTGARLAKLLRTDRARARRAARELLWEKGIRTAARDLRVGYEFGALVATLRVMGALLALPVALAVPLREGHLGGRRGR